jgi:hypothetical protein
MSVATDKFLIAAAASAQTQSPVHLAALGLSIAVIVPALFWTAVLAGVGMVTKIELAAASLLFTGFAIAMFLGAVCAPIMFRRRLP